MVHLQQPSKSGGKRCTLSTLSSLTTLKISITTKVVCESRGKIEEEKNGPTRKGRGGGEEKFYSSGRVDFLVAMVSLHQLSKSGGERCTQSTLSSLTTLNPPSRKKERKWTVKGNGLRERRCNIFEICRDGEVLRAIVAIDRHGGGWLTVLMNISSVAFV